MLLYCKGEKSEDIFNSFGLTADDVKTVMEKFDNHFVIKRDTIFDRAKFNLRKQEHDETVKAFITALHKLSELATLVRAAMSLSAIELSWE